jgi:hypothetical protein
MAAAESIDGMQPRIILYRGWDEGGRHVWSPFVIKLEARLRLAGVAYKTDIGSARSAPKGKVPYLEYVGPLPGSDEVQRVAMADSSLIIQTLSGWRVVPDLNAKVAPETRAHDLALRAMLEDKLYFYHVRLAS